MGLQVESGEAAALSSPVFFIHQAVLAPPSLIAPKIPEHAPLGPLASRRLSN
jgi:hypothetical protein